MSEQIIIESLEKAVEENLLKKAMYNGKESFRLISTSVIQEEVIDELPESTDISTSTSQTESTTTNAVHTNDVDISNLVEDFIDFKYFVSTELINMKEIGQKNQKDVLLNVEKRLEALEDFQGAHMLNYENGSENWRKNDFLIESQKSYVYT